jgi:hypothetical protein
MKVYFKYAGEPTDFEPKGGRLGREAYEPKITLPAKWLEGPVSKLISFFCETYNKKFPEKTLDPENVRLVCRGVEVPPEAVVTQYIEEYNDLLIQHLPAPKAVEKIPEGSLLCTNYGCGKRFLPEENNQHACAHHAKPPVFHDTYKFWSCCPEKKAMDFDEFESIPPCVVGPHSTENAVVKFTSEPVNNVALSEDQVRTMKQQQEASPLMEAGPRRTGPREFEGAKDTMRKPQEIKDGKATCRNFGCQKEFVVAANTDTSCQYHVEGPVFWDTYKYWKCCPQKKCIDFDDFAVIPGCAVGPHRLD